MSSRRFTIFMVHSQKPVRVSQVWFVMHQHLISIGKCNEPWHEQCGWRCIRWFFFRYFVIIEIIHADAALAMLLYSVATFTWVKVRQVCWFLFVLLKLSIFPPSDPSNRNIQDLASLPNNRFKSWMKNRLSPEYPERRVNNMAIFGMLCFQLKPQPLNIHDMNLKSGERKIRSLRYR